MKQLKVVLHVPYITWEPNETYTFRWEISDKVASRIEKIMQEKGVSVVSDEMIDEAIKARKRGLKPLHDDLRTIGYDNLVCALRAEDQYEGPLCMDAVYETGLAIHYDICFLNKGEGKKLYVPSTIHTYRWSLKRFLKNLKPKEDIDEWDDEM